VPPLRQRGEDILTLFTRLGEQFADEYGCEAPEVSAQEAAQLLQAPWPGNVRQLINVAERAVLQNRRGTGSIASLLMTDPEEMKPAWQHRRCHGRAMLAAQNLERKDGEIRIAAG